MPVRMKLNRLKLNKSVFHSFNNDINCLKFSRISVSYLMKNTYQVNDIFLGSVFCGIGSRDNCADFGCRRLDEGGSEGRWRKRVGGIRARMKRGDRGRTWDKLRQRATLKWSPGALLPFTLAPHPSILMSIAELPPSERGKHFTLCTGSAVVWHFPNNSCPRASSSELDSITTTTQCL